MHHLPFKIVSNALLSSCFDEAPPSYETWNVLWLVGWTSVLWLANCLERFKY